MTEEKKLEGLTIYMSWMSMKFLSINELKSILSHELGHFVGKDLYYTTKFLPLYYNLENNIHLIEGDSLHIDDSGIEDNDENDNTSIAFIPILNYLKSNLKFFDDNFQNIFM